MPKIYVIFVSPKYQGNIGSLARIMKNFDLEDLILVNPQTEINDEAYKYAMHGDNILKNAKIVGGFQDRKRRFPFRFDRCDFFLGKKEASFERK